MRLGVALLHLERVCQLGGEHLLGAREHLLLAGREALVGLADGEVADHLGELEHVAGLDLVAVVLEATVPVLRHLADVGAEHRDHALDRVLVDHSAQPGLGRVLARDHHGHLVVDDLDCEVLALGAEYVAYLLLEDLAGPVMGVDHVVADLVVDLDVDHLEAIELVFPGCVSDGVLLFVARPEAAVLCQVCRWRSTRLVSCKPRRPSRISLARTSPTLSIASNSSSLAPRISSSPSNERTMASMLIRGR